MVNTKNMKYLALAAALYLFSAINVNAAVDCSELVNQRYHVPKGAATVVVTSAVEVTNTRMIMTACLRERHSAISTDGS